jgi:cation-transporting ATPase 13A3/4/5
MSPEDKKMLMGLIQERLGKNVGFCGDGANDCGALKAADIGISLSDSEASVAAPFASACKDVSCVLTVLKEGRAALSTSFAAFKFMALYSMIQFTSLLLLYSRGSSLGDYQFVWIDLLLILPLGALMSRFEPADRLCPGSPETKLVSSSVLSSLLSQISLQIIAQTYIYFESIDSSILTPGSVASPSDTPIVLGPANTAVFLCSLFIYLVGAGLFSSWRPFRKFYAPFYSYAALMLALSFVLIWVAGENNFLSQWLELVSISDALKMKVVIVSVLYWIVSFLIEYLILYLKN